MAKKIPKDDILSDASIERMLCFATESPLAGAWGPLSEIRSELKSPSFGSSQYHVLIKGETGTGKEILAKEIFERTKYVPAAPVKFGEIGFSLTGKTTKQRNEELKNWLCENRERKEREKIKDYISLNCAQFTEPLLAAELFGHEPHVFTDAGDVPKLGLLEIYDAIFLDEIGAMSSELQAALLRVLQEKQFRRVGGTETHKVSDHFRVVAATNETTALRDDLIWRFQRHITLPPLRERILDVFFILRKLVDNFLKEHEMHQGIAIRIPFPVLIRMLYSPWAGNVRELENAVRVLGQSTIKKVRSSGSNKKEISTYFFYYRGDYCELLADPEAMKQVRAEIMKRVFSSPSYRKYFGQKMFRGISYPCESLSPYLERVSLVEKLALGPMEALDITNIPLDTIGKGKRTLTTVCSDIDMLYPTLNACIRFALTLLDAKDIVIPQSVSSIVVPPLYDSTESHIERCVLDLAHLVLCFHRDRDALLALPPEVAARYPQDSTQKIVRGDAKGSDLTGFTTKQDLVNEWLRQLYFKHGGQRRGTNAAISKFTGLSETTVGRDVAELRKSGKIP